jgi:signal transduction histidine kinase
MTFLCVISCTWCKDIAKRHIQDLTRLESGQETSFNEPFDLQSAIEEATRLYRNEARRRDIDFQLDVSDGPETVIGDSKKIQTVVANLTANARTFYSSPM